MNNSFPYIPVIVTTTQSLLARAQSRTRSTGYQSEADLENELLLNLEDQGYERVAIHNEEQLLENARIQIGKLNNIEFTDSEWDSFLKSFLANPAHSIADKAFQIHNRDAYTLTREDGTRTNIRIFDARRLPHNNLQVINQYIPPTDGALAKNRYDVTILVNGIPMVHVELKRRGVELRQAFDQIARFDATSFSAGSQLFRYVQIFVISNGTQTKYYSTTTRRAHVKNLQNPSQKTSNAQALGAFEFTSYWAGPDNKPILDLVNFTRTFFAKDILRSILAHYCVFTADHDVMVMRPYQIMAVEQIIKSIQMSMHNGQFTSGNAGGFIWHTTGSGKTLTSFKTAQLATQIPEIDKVLFVVDRKDLDYQTIREYERFSPGAANSNADTKALAAQLVDPNTRIIVTTIQKLATFAKKNPKHEVYLRNTVFIFDECHRSQHGDMHALIRKRFKKYLVFGFTGTPIKQENAITNARGEESITAEIFGRLLHSYTIVNAINDGNVLRFLVDYNEVGAKKISGRRLAPEEMRQYYRHPDRIEAIVDYVLTHFDSKTKRDSSTAYTHKVISNIDSLIRTRSGRHTQEILEAKRLKGFNAIMTVDSTESARKYYNIFRAKNHALPEDKQLKIAMIFSPTQPEEDSYAIDDDVDLSGALMPDAQGHGSFLEDAILDYDAMFGTQFAGYNATFDQYYKDISLRMKNREIDLLLVVNMFLTGFDAKTLNTLFVDRNLKNHGLIQAFSRTNRILNSVKKYGYIMCFRDLDEQVDDALRLFSNPDDAEDTTSLAKLPPYEELHRVYLETIRPFMETFAPGERVDGKELQQKFIAEFGSIRRQENILRAFDEFENDERINDRDMQDYTSEYLRLYDLYKEAKEKGTDDFFDELIFEIELIRQIEVDSDYILSLIAKYQREGHKPEIRDAIMRAIVASPSLRDKKDLFEEFIDVTLLAPLSPLAGITARTAPEIVEDLIFEEWNKFIETKETAELEAIINLLKLRPENTRRFIDQAFHEGYVSQTGSDINSILPPTSRFGGDKGDRLSAKRKLAADKLTRHLERFKTILSRSKF